MDRIEVTGLDWSIEARIILALMREIGETEMTFTPKQMEPDRGLIFEEIQGRVRVRRDVEGWGE